MDFLTIFLPSFFLTIFVYLVFPIVYRIITDGATSEKASRLALINSIVGYIIFSVIYIIARADKIASAPVAFTYYWIARAIMTKKEETKQPDEKEETTLQVDASLIEKEETTSQVEIDLIEKKEIKEETVQEDVGIVPKKWENKNKTWAMTKEVITVGSIVTIYDEEIGEEIYKIVSAKSGKDENEIHISAPLAQALVGHTVGEEVTVKAENEYKIKIIKVGGTKMQIPENHRRSNRNIYFVFQGLQAEHEIMGGYLFAVCREEIAHYRRLKRLKKGDIVIHCYKQHIVAVSEVTKECCVKKRPAAHYLANDKKDASGWMVDVKCQRLRYAINVSNYKDEIIGLQGNGQGKGYPFNYKGTGNQGYLFNMNRVLALFFLKKIMETDPSIRELDYMQDIHNEIKVSKLKIFMD